MRETVLRFAACAAYLIALPRAFAVTAGGRGETVGKAGDLRRAPANAGRVELRAVVSEGRPCDQQSDNPDRAAMRVAAVGGAQHLLLAGAADLREFGT